MPLLLTAYLDVPRYYRDQGRPIDLQLRQLNHRRTTRGLSAKAHSIPQRCRAFFAPPTFRAELCGLS